MPLTPGRHEGEPPALFDPSLIDSAHDADDIMALSYKPMAVLRLEIIVIGDAEFGKKSPIKSFLSGSRCPGEYGMMTDIDMSVGGVPVTGTNFTVDLFVYHIPGQSMFIRVHVPML